MDYTPNIDAQGMRRPMGPVDQPNWNGGPNLATIFMSRSLSGALLMKVLIHELGHCALVSYSLLDDIHKVVKPEYWIWAEEWVCNFIADYGTKIFSIAYSVLGNDAWMFIPYELDRVIA